MAHPFTGGSVDQYLREHEQTTTGGGNQIGDIRWVTNSVGLLEEQEWLGSRWIATGQVRNPLSDDAGGTGGTPRTQFESERALDLASAQRAVAEAEATLASIETDRRTATTAEARQQADASFQRWSLIVDKRRLDFEKLQSQQQLTLDRDRLDADIAATKQRLEEIRLESELAFKHEDRLLTKRLDAEKEMLLLRLDNSMRELLFGEIGAERRALIAEQGAARRQIGELQGQDPFRQANLLGGQAQRGRTPAAQFGQQLQSFVNQPLPQANIQDPIAQLQAQLTGAQQRPQLPTPPPVGLARGGVIEMEKAPSGAFSMKPQSFFVGEVNGRVIPGITEIMTVGDGKVVVTPLSGGFQFGGTLGGFPVPTKTTPEPTTFPIRIVPPTQPPLIEGQEPVPPGPEVAELQPGTLVRFGDNEAVFYVDPNTGELRWISDADVFLSSGFDFADVKSLASTAADTFTFGAPITETFEAGTSPPPPQLIAFGDAADRSVYYFDPETGQYRFITNPEAFLSSGLDFGDVVALDPTFSFGLESRLNLGDPIEDTFTPLPPPPELTPPVEEPPVTEPPPPGPTQQDILAGLQALAPGFAGLSQFVPRTQEGPFGGTQAMRDFFSFQGQNLVQDPFSGAFRPFLPGLPEGVDPQALLNAPTSFGAPVVNQGAFNLQNLSTLGFDPALVRLGGQEDIFYRDPTTGELRQFGTPDIFEQSGFNLADVFNISPTGQNFQFGAPITSPLGLPPNTNTVGPFRMPLIDPFTGALLFDPFQNASNLNLLQQENPTSFNNLLSAFGTAGLDPTGFQSRLDLATPTGRFQNPQRIGFRGGFF